MRRARAAPHHASDGGGRAWIELEPGKAAQAVASSLARWTLIYEVGPAGIAQGGAVRFLGSPYFNWSKPQTLDPMSPGYTTVECTVDGVRLDVETRPTLHVVQAIVRERALAAGDRLRVVYGAGSALARVDPFAEREARLWLSVDGNGDGVSAIVYDSPTVEILPGAAARMSLLLPSTAQPGESVRLHVALLDRIGNVATGFRGTVQLETRLGGVHEIEFAPEHGGVRIVELVAQEMGVERVEGSVKGIQGTSNPLLVETHAPRVLWGDLHGHSNLSDGTGRPEDYLAYARDVAGLDVVALTDHDHWGILFLDEHPELVERIARATQAANEPGRFVTLLGYEWTNFVHGHRHVLAFGDELPLHSWVDPACETPTQLWGALRGKDVLTFAHHSAGGPVPTNWDFAPDPELEPVTEITSVHGVSEADDTAQTIYSAWPGNFVRDALGRGYRLGFVGSGDGHDGHPGLTAIATGQGGLAAILSEERTRGAVKQALRGRRVYATNGPRIVLRAAIEETRMGEIAPAPASGTLSKLYVRALACAPLEHIDVIRSGEVVLRLDGTGQMEVETVQELADLRAGEWVYVRAVQADDGMAWSSPIYFE
jgi:hypothetical protein